jgi:mono/diheme cytochrome c family protein
MMTRTCCLRPCVARLLLLVVAVTTGARLLVADDHASAPGRGASPPKLAPAPSPSPPDEASRPNPPQPIPGNSQAAADEDASDRTLQRQWADEVLPFVRTYCGECHGAERQEAKLDLSPYQSLAAVAAGHATWELVLDRLQAGDMPPAEAARRPSSEQTAAVIAWLRSVRRFQAARHAGDPGSVPTRRLSNAEYNYAVRDLTGVDIRPTRSFPVDPANEAGFDNSAESLTMSPALLHKYLEAARLVVDHLVLKPHGFDFAPHPVVTDTDRDKYAVKRIVDFYQRQPTDYAAYLYAAWRYQQRAVNGQPGASVAEIAAQEGVSAKYLTTVWSTLNDPNETVGPIATLQALWQALPREAGRVDEARAQCEAMRDDIVRLRAQLTFTFPDLEGAGVYKGSQSFVLWKNRQYAAHRRRCNQEALIVAEEPEANESAGQAGGLRIPAEPAAQAAHRAACDRFCNRFPDAFSISERGRDYLGIPKEKQEKGRLLSAGFHSMMGYFRDDQPLYDLVLDEPAQQQLDRLWRELDFITAAPLRQFTGFIWFERTDTNFLRDPEFDFARAEDKDVTSEPKIRQLAAAYLHKVRTKGGQGVTVQAIEDYFRNMNEQIRAVERARQEAEPSHESALQDFARRAYRRPLTAVEQQDLARFYLALRAEAGLSHEEAFKDTLVTVLMSPHFLYRLDLAESRPGIHSLSDHELASRLSFFLWSSLPDQQLLDRAAAGELRRPEVLLAETKRLLRDERIRALAVEFGGNWLDFRRFETHNGVDRQRFPEFTDVLRQAMYEEPIRFFEDLVRHDRGVHELLHGNYTFVNATLAQHYGIGERILVGDEWQRIDDAGRFGRGGLLPMSVFLTANSPGLRTSPVKRGYWVARRLLGERIPAPPPNVPELPADESKLELSLRETLARHRNHQSCAGCHNRFDSLGLPFEAFGPTGAIRDRDLAGRPIESQATFPDGSEGIGLAGLRRYLREQREAEFVDNLSRKLLAYALGRTLLLSDELLVETICRNLAANDLRFSALVETIVLSPQFLSKRGPDQQQQEQR